MRRSLPALLLVVLLGCLALAGCSTTSSRASSDSGFGGDGGVAMIEPADRQPAPDVVGDRLGGGRVEIRDWRGQASIVNIWASWCGPCRQEAPQLASAARAMPDVRFVGVTIRDNPSSAATFEANHRIPYDSVLDPSGEIVLGFQGLVNPNALPYTIVIDSNGDIAAVIAGATTASTLEGVVQDVEKAT